jgi:hypothetical protein
MHGKNEIKKELYDAYSQLWFLSIFSIVDAVVIPGIPTPIVITATLQEEQAQIVYQVLIGMYSRFLNS